METASARTAQKTINSETLVERIERMRGFLKGHGNAKSPEDEFRFRDEAWKEVEADAKKRFHLK